jgi:hypothetical protein
MIELKKLNFEEAPKRPIKLCVAFEYAPNVPISSKMSFEKVMPTPVRVIIASGVICNLYQYGKIAQTSTGLAVNLNQSNSRNRFYQII